MLKWKASNASYFFLNCNLIIYKTNNPTPADALNALICIFLFKPNHAYHSILSSIASLKMGLI